MSCQASLRANRLYDTERTRLRLRKWVDWYRKYRAILTSDIIHGQRPEGRNLDCSLHVNPQLREKGMVLCFNPLEGGLTRKVRLLLYFTGLRQTAWIREQENGRAKRYRLDRDYGAEHSVTLPPRGVTWFLIEGDPSSRSGRWANPGSANWPPSPGRLTFSCTP